MTRPQFFKHFELLADQPDAVAKMRELILELAVRGQIVELNKSDEPVTELLQRVEAQRKKIKASGESRIPNNFEAVDESEHPWPAPKHWAWRRLAELVLFIDYRGKTPVKTNKGVRLLTAKNVRKGYVSLEPEEFIAEDSYQQWMTRGIPRIGDVLFTTEAPLGNAAVLELKERVALAQRTINFRLFADCDPKFMVLSICSRPYQEFLEIHATGMTATGIKSAKLKFLPFPIPPLAEQQRIVAKVDELMALCDELEQRQQARQHASGLLQQSALHHLLAAREPQTFAAAWQRVRDHFHLLHDTPDAILQLRQAILQLAVQGRLVPQNPKDEPASAIIERVLQDNVQASKEKPHKIGVQPVAEQETPHAIPSSWVWSRAQHLVQPQQAITYGILKPVWVQTGVPTVRVTEMKTGTIDVAALPRCDERRAAKFSKTRLAEGDLLISKDGTIGKTAFVPPELAGGNITQHVLRFPISNQLNRRFVQFCIDSPYAQTWMAGETIGVALKGVNVGDFRRMPIPIPPLAEQKRIVARVEELLRWCDTLEAQLHQTRTLGAHLLASTLHHLLAA